MLLSIDVCKGTTFRRRNQFYGKALKNIEYLLQNVF